MSEIESVAKKFFLAQDTLRGGPDPDICAPGYSMTLNGQPSMDLAGHTAFATAFYAGFPDLRHEIDNVQVDGVTELVEFRVVGTHQGEFMGIPPTGKSINASARVQAEVADGKIKSFSGTFDQATMLSQLGVA